MSLCHAARKVLRKNPEEAIIPLTLKTSNAALAQRQHTSDIGHEVEVADAARCQMDVRLRIFNFQELAEVPPSVTRGPHRLQNLDKTAQSALAKSQGDAP